MKCAVSVYAPYATVSSTSYPVYIHSASLEICRWKDGILLCSYCVHYVHR